MLFSGTSKLWENKVVLLFSFCFFAEILRNSWVWNNSIYDFLLSDYKKQSDTFDCEDGLLVEKENTKEITKDCKVSKQMLTKCKFYSEWMSPVIKVLNIYFMINPTLAVIRRAFKINTTNKN